MSWETTSNTHIVEYQDSDFPPSEHEVRRIWNSLPVELAPHLVLLDKFTMQDEFFIPLRSDCVARLEGAGFNRVGDLIATNSEEVAKRANLSSQELRRLTGVLERMGLHFATDVSRWREYRGTVDEQFRLRVPYGIKLPQGSRSPFDT